MQHLILPTVVLSLLFIAQWSRFMRSSMLEVIRTDYMRTAAAKGVSRTAVILKHGLKNALIPLVTVVALSLPGLVAGAVVTETIFAWPGMGRLFYNALGQFDFALLMGYMMLVSFLVVFFNLVADIVLRVARPAREVHLTWPQRFRSTRPTSPPPTTSRRRATPSGGVSGATRSRWSAPSSSC